MSGDANDHFVADGMYPFADCGLAQPSSPVANQ